jgi:hypothetical protein
LKPCILAWRRLPFAGALVGYDRAESRLCATE